MKTRFLPYLSKKRMLLYISSSRLSASAGHFIAGGKSFIYCITILVHVYTLRESNDKCLLKK